MRSRSFPALALASAVLMTGCVSVPTDPTETAALAGDPGALNTLCYGYIYGKQGYIQNYDRALMWCRKGAESGDPNDETLYAEMYYEGDGVKKDMALARTWYKRAAEQGHEHAEFMMALSELESSKPDFRNFCYWLAKAKLQNYDKALNLYDNLQQEWSKSHPDKPPLCSDVDLNSEPSQADE